MFLDSGFMRTQDILHHAMSASTIRQEVIADNIANADTPHFKRRPLRVNCSEHLTPMTRILFRQH